MNIYIQVALPVPLHQTFTYLYEDFSVVSTTENPTNNFSNKINNIITSSTSTTTNNNTTNNNINNKINISANKNINLVGRRVLVPFGRGKKTREITGLVLSQSTDAPEINQSSIKKITEVIDSEAIFSNSMLQFLRWIADYYISPIGEVVKAALPNGISPKTVHKFSLNHELLNSVIQDISKKSEVRHKLIQYLESNPIASTIEQLEKQCEISNVRYHIQYLLDNNFLKIDSTVKTKIKPKIQKAVKISPELLENKKYFQEVLKSLDKRAHKQSQILAVVAIEQQKNNNKPVLFTTIDKIINRQAGSHIMTNSNLSSAINSLINKKILTLCEVEIDRNAHSSDENKLSHRDESLLELTNEQQTCLTHIKKSIDNSNYKAFLLHGVTGSGKTLVYIHAILSAIKSGKSAMLLVPEISLTPQLVDRFKNVFADLVTVFHSRMSEAQRYDSWRNVLSGRASIVIGARSALFAPLVNLGLIIVDEEHETSYKQTNQQPYYQARDAAMYRAMLEKATVVLGSATPSLETYYNTQIGKIELLEILNRADGASLPNVKVIDMISAKRNSQVINNFSYELVTKIKEKLEKKEGVILFQNKRGFSNYLECEDCGDIQQCPNCSISLTYHQVSSELRCHYCGYTKKTRNTCPSCGKIGLTSVGAGTQRIEEDLANILSVHLPEKKVNISRLDLDSTVHKGYHRKILHDFAIGNTDILLGTQMVAKGLDFHRVALVGVINADIQLNLPDFRASERTFQLLSQVAGRAGRSGQIKGEVIIQTRQAERYAISSVINSDFKKFYDIEIKERQEVLFPPFVRYCVIEFSSIDGLKAENQAQNFYKILPQHESLIFFQPIPAPISKINKKYRWLISIKSIKAIDSSGKYLRKAIKIALEKYNKNIATNSVNIKIDIDSYSSF